MKEHLVARSFALTRTYSIMKRHIRWEIASLRPTRPSSFRRRNVGYNPFTGGGRR